MDGAGGRGNFFLRGPSNHIEQTSADMSLKCNAKGAIKMNRKIGGLVLTGILAWTMAVSARRGGMRRG